MLVDTCCGRLFVEVLGEGPDVVLWPSLLTDGGLWHHQLNALTEHYRVVSIDPPGHGRSDPTRRPYRLDDCVGAALSVLDEVGAHEPAWCGLSWGGMVGMRLAARHPRRLSSLVLAATSARGASWPQRVRYGLLSTIVRRVGPVDPLLKQVLPLFFARASEHPDEVRRFEEHVRSMDVPSIGYAVDAVLLWRDDVTELVGRVAVPTLVIAGEQDTALPPSEARHLARIIPGALLVTVPAAGHLVCQEAPEQFNAELLRFLARAARGRAQERPGPGAAPRFDTSRGAVLA